MPTRTRHNKEFASSRKSRKQRARKQRGGGGKLKMNADQVKKLTNKYIREVGSSFPEQIEAMKEEKKSVGARKFKIVEYLPFQQWYSRRYTLRLRILNSNLFEEFYKLSIANTLKKIKESSCEKYDLTNIEVFHTNIFTNEKTLIPQGTDFTVPDPYPEYIISKETDLGVYEESRAVFSR